MKKTVLDMIPRAELLRRYLGDPVNWINGESVRSLSKWMGIAQASFPAYRRMFKIPYRGYAQINPEIVRLMVLAGRSDLGIALRLNCTRTAVWKIRKSLGVTRTPKKLSF